MKKAQRRIVLCDVELEAELDLLMHWHGSTNRVDALAFLLRHISPRLRNTCPADWLGKQTEASSMFPHSASSIVKTLAAPTAPASTSSTDDGIDLDNMFL